MTRALLQRAEGLAERSPLRANADAMEACFDLARRIDAVNVMCVGGLLFCGPDTRACWDARHRFLTPILLDTTDFMASRGEPFVTAHYSSALAAQARSHFTKDQLQAVARYLSLSFHPGQGHSVEFHRLRYDARPYLDRLEATGCYPARFTDALRESTDR